ncbi:MAG: glycosyltransferase family 4 protein [Caldilineales bacterium]
MRLCIIANPTSIHTHRWLTYFVQQGHEVHLIGDLPHTGALPAGIIYHDLTALTNTRKLRYLAWAPRVRRLVRSLRPDVLHAQYVAGPGWLGAAAGMHPFLLSAWGSDLLVGPRRSRLQRTLARWALARADYVTCVSQQLADVAVEMGVEPARSEVLTWGVDLDLFHPLAQPERAALRDRLGVGDRPFVLSIRPVQPVYNPLQIARAVPLVIERVPDALFAVFTYRHDPALMAQFRAIVEEAGAGEAVRYVPPLAGDREIAAYSQAADVAVSVSRSDGTPTSVLEAMACGAAMVVSDLPSVREWVGSNAGAVAPLDDPAATANAIADFVQDGDRRRRVQEAARQVIARRADRRLNMQRAGEIYAALAAGRTPQPLQEGAGQTARS